MQKNFVLDTNVLIHNPGALYSFADNKVIVPIKVIEELDNLKSSSDKKGMHARQVLREIDKLVRKGAVEKGVKMKSGGTLEIYFDKKGAKLPELDIEMPDNKILAAAWHIQESGEPVFFVSKDVNARIKAEAMGIKARDYEKQKVEYNTLYRGWKEIPVPKSQIDQIYKDGFLDIKAFAFNQHEYAVLKASDDPSSSALAKYDAVEKKLTLLRKEYEAMNIRPRNMEQRFALDLLLDDKVQLVTLVGQAGTGKTLLAIAAALSKTIGRNPLYKKVLVARPVIPMGKDIGYLPGSKDQKLSYWMRPIYDNLEYILHDHKEKPQHKEPPRPKNPRELEEMDYEDDDYKDGHSLTGTDRVDYLIRSGVLEIEALTYIRGRSIPSQFLIVDEAQNLTPHEIKTIVSRAGEGTKLVLTGDCEQIDNPYLDANSNGLSYVVEHLKDQKLVGHVFLSKSERSELASLAVEYL